jgi:DNA-binding transcriptional LysR family regulator
MYLNINQLRYFYIAAKKRSVTMAAQELMVTPPAVTVQVRRLEKDLGVRLMYRDGNGLSLTKVGLKIYRRAEKIFEEIQDMEKYVDEISKNQTGELRIGCPLTPAKYLLPGLIDKFNENYPEIRIILSIGTTSELIPKLLDKKIDLAWVRYTKGEKRIRIKLVGTEDVYLVASADSKWVPQDTISVNQLPALPLIVQGRQSGMGQVVNEYLKRFVKNAQVAMELDSDDLIKEVVRKDTALCFLERFAIKKELDEGILKKINIMEGSPQIEMGLGYYQKKHLSPAAWFFVGLLDSIDFNRTIINGDL